MKKIKKFIKLSNRNLENLNEKEQSVVVAGAESYCSCGCFYSDCGGSSIADNTIINIELGLCSVEPVDEAEWNGAPNPC